jgi:hypothetical protein
MTCLEGVDSTLPGSKSYQISCNTLILQDLVKTMLFLHYPKNSQSYEFRAHTSSFIIHEMFWYWKLKIQCMNGRQDHSRITA